MLEKTVKITQSNWPVHPHYMSANHVPQCHIHMILKNIQGWWLYHLPGYLFPVPHHSFWEEMFPNIQPEPPRHNLRSVPLVLLLLPGRRGRHPSHQASFQAVAERYKIFSEPSLLQSEPPSCSPWDLCSRSLTTLLCFSEHVPRPLSL